MLDRPFALAWVTSRDLLRRPGAWLAAGGAAILLFLLPRLAARALDDDAALATELALSTISLYAALFAALAGVQAAARGTDLGPSTSLLVTPLTPGEYVTGRLAGIVVAALTHVAILALLALLALLAGGGAPPAPDLAIAALGLLCFHVLLVAALGLAVGSLCGSALGVVVVLALLVVGRAIAPTLAGDAGIAAWWVPDLARLDVAREAGFARALGAGAVLAAAAAALLQTTGWLALARVAIERRATTDDGPEHATS